MNRIRWPLQFDVEVEGHTILAPKALVRIRYAGGQWSRTIRALVDTGSPMTIVSPRLAAKLGWMQPPGEAPLNLGGLGGAGGHPGWRAEMDVAFVQGPTQKSTEGLLLLGSAVFVSALADREAVLIGQHESLERLTFLQRNQSPYQDFALALPDALEP